MIYSHIPVLFQPSHTQGVVQMLANSIYIINRKLSHIQTYANNSIDKFYIYIYQPVNYIYIVTIDTDFRQ
jgi:hypothetical protein